MRIARLASLLKMTSQASHKNRRMAHERHIKGELEKFRAPIVTDNFGVASSAQSAKSSYIASILEC